MTIPATLQAPLALGATTVARAWAVTRADGLSLGFTDHDGPLSFDGLLFRPNAGLSARAVVHGTGLAVDNTEALGVLSDDGISEADLEAGRWDGAEVRLWHVDWTHPESRALRFRGTLGEVRRGAGAFHAELRGLSEALNRPLGRLYQASCPAVLGDAACRVDLSGAPFAEVRPAGLTDGRTFRLEGFGLYARRWWERGRLLVLTGAARGLSGTIKHDAVEDGARVIELWSALRAPVAPEDQVRLVAGCDKRLETCRLKFANTANFRGFPFVPGDDWLLSVPSRTARNDGGSLRS